MDTRATIEAILDQAYAARRGNDAEAAAACFTHDGRFLANGAQEAAKSPPDRMAAMKGMFAAFEVRDMQVHCRIIDPPHAVVHWRGRFRLQNGKEGETDILDLIEMRDGRICSLTSFFDTAFAMAMSAPD